MSAHALVDVDVARAWRQVRAALSRLQLHEQAAWRDEEATREEWSGTRARLAYELQRARVLLEMARRDALARRLRATRQREHVAPQLRQEALALHGLVVGSREQLGGGR